MIRSFKCRFTEALFDNTHVKQFVSIERIARRKLRYLNSVESLLDLRIPPNNRLETLKGARKGQYSIRINDRYRVCFRWEKDGVHDVEIVDYHS